MNLFQIINSTGRKYPKALSREGKGDSTRAFQDLLCDVAGLLASSICSPLHVGQGQAAGLSTVTSSIVGGEKERSELK